VVTPRVAQVLRLVCVEGHAGQAHWWRWCRRWAVLV